MSTISIGTARAFQRRPEGLPGLWSALDVAVLEETGDEYFASLDVLPAWFLDLTAGAGDGAAFDLAERFPFLEYFLEDARAFWASEMPGRLESGPWSETATDGGELALEATALFHAEKRIVLIALLGKEYEERRRLLQRIRDTYLDLQSLSRGSTALGRAAAAQGSVLAAIPDTMFRLRRDGSYLDFTSGDGCGAKPPRLSRQGNVSDVLPAEAAKELLGRVERVLAIGDVQAFEFEAGEDGAPRSFEARVAPCGAEEVFVMVRDITERKLAEDEIARRLEQIRAHRDDLLLILNGLSIGAALAAEDGRCVFISAAAKKWLEIEDDFVGQSRCDELPIFGLREKRLLREMASCPEAQRTRVPAEWERQNGGKFWMEVEIRDDPTTPERRIYLFHDVTALQDLRRQLDERGSFENLVGRSKSMVEVYRLTEELANVDSTVLIEGETGTGKELAAKALHSLGARKNGPFVAVNCAGLTETLVASQLFGHRRGSFTGAVADSRGVFEAANGGVLFLDEIGDIPPAVQTSLLRVLQEREITRIGDTTPRKVDVRVIAATHRDLQDEVAKGSFRVDLLYRVRVARIQLPPLRHRKEDLPLLAARFLGEFRAATGKPVADISLDAMRLMQEHDWPGNVREMRSALEVAVIRCRRAVIGIDDLPVELRAGTGVPPSAAHDPFAGKSEEERIRLAIEQTNGNRSEAAKRLGMSRATFYRRLAQLNISLES